ncbi:MBG domain-containing protein [Bradyrhizobium sp. McL0615]|uniref:MBG domain-containing protein n=1 Tax=Bradyrhizobium sp. McL0615 TaxID=3415673 RepID=UPI003CEF990A
MIVSSTSDFSSAITSFTRDFRASVSLIALLWGLGCAQPSFAQSLPTGGTVASGNVSINSASPTSLTISQSSRTGIVNWSSFSIGQGNQVQFNNGSGATLNRVTGNVPSSINGMLSATGSVYLVNPSGVVVGPSGEIKTGGSFVASTLDVKDAEFRAGGSLTFSGNSNASVVNLGKIGASKGDVVLIARQVRNDGALAARNGTAAMASGSEVVLSDGSLGNGKVLVRRPAQDGEIRNSGAIRAAEVELRANGGNIYALAGNTGRAITATGVASKGGRIFLTAEGGSVNVTQKVVARRIQANVSPASTRAARGAFIGGDVIVSGDKVVVGGTIKAKGSNGAGGTVVVTGKDVTLTSTAAIDASGTSGGTVLIGGDRAGGSDAALKFLPQTIANAQNTTIEAGATITADGTSGAGGNVVVWSDGTTSFAGAISTQGLRGGFIETSGHVFNFTGGSVNAGKGGAWLLDPVDLTIDATLAGTIATALDGGSNVTQQTSATGNGGNGDITVASGISWASDATLTLSAYRNIAVNANIASLGGGGVVLRADNAGTGAGTVTFGGGQVSTAGAVSIFYNLAGDSSTLNATKYTAPTQTNFSGNVTGGATLKTYMLVNTVYDLQNIKNNLSGVYALGRDIDAGATASWNGGAGFTPVGGSNAFTGTFDGQGQTISNLTINRPSGQWVGLFGYNGASATVSNLGLLNVSVTGNTATGGVVGENHGTITGVYTSGSVASNAGAGGIVGYNYGPLSNVYSSSAVSAPTIYAGGIAGLSLGNISQAYATGPVSGGSNVGGLVGYSGGSITQSYATGAVSGTSNVGGLLGYNGGSITQSYWDSYTTGQAAGIGAGAASSGLNEVTSDPAQSGAANDAYRQSAYVGFDFTPGNTSTGWFSIDGQTRPFGQWEYSTNISNAHQLQLMAMDPNASYRLTSNIDFSSGLAAGGKYPGMWSPSGFSPIGDLSSQFGGSLDGQGHAISNLAINRPSDAYIGLIGYIGTGGSVSNLGLQNATITGNGYVGGLTGFNNGSISNVSVSGAITGALRVGGLIGQNYSNGTIGNASASGTVVATTIGYAGGLVAVNYGSISGSFATVDVSGNGSSVAPFGGLVGWNSSSSSIIQNSYATGTVSSGTGSTRTGGLAGQNDGTILRSYATGAVQGGSQGTGGLVGYNGTGATSITESYATGTVTAAALAGGLVGSAAVGGTISNTYATGAVSITSASLVPFAGGLIGNNAGTVKQSYATGTVNVASTSPTAVAAAGGLIGSNASTATVTQSYATGAANASAPGTAMTMAGGLIGRNIAGATVSQSYATGAASATAAAGAAMAGGLIGNHASTGTVAQTYATGTASATSVSGTAAAGGLIGSITGTGAITASYWDTDTSGRTNAVGSGAGTGITGLTTAQMQNPANYASTYMGWDFATVWSAPSIGYYPQLYGVNYVLRVDPANASRVYGDANPAFTYSIYGFHAGDTAAIINGLSVSTVATTTSNAGTYAISASGGSAVSASGRAYRFIDAPGTLTVTPRSITVAADAASRVYGDANPAFTYQVGGSGLVNGDRLSGALATAATAASNVGVYGIAQGTLGSPNYTISSFTGANLTVTSRAITVTADARSRAYGDANPVLTYQVGGAGLANGDTLSGALATSATTASNVGVYGITQGTLAASSNYTLSSFTGANLTVTPRAITVAADAKSRTYGDANPTLTYQVGGSGLVNGDTLSGALATSATTSSNVGAYGIGQGTLAASGNYALNYASANLTVTPRAITVTADAKSRTYGDLNPVLTYQVGGAGLVNGDTLSGALATSATTASNVGVYGIGQGTLASPNYAISLFTGANLAVTQRAITVTADTKSRAYGDANPALTYQVGGLGLANGDTLSGALTTSATTSSNAGIYGITQGTLAASSNYAFAFVGANLTVAPAAATPTKASRVPTAELAAYVESRQALPAPQPPEQMREVASTEQSSPAIICNSRQCLELPHPNNRRIGDRARFIDTMINRNRLPAFVDN